ncbi:MAG: hypothetical protein QJR06_10125 [Alicyclobacillaceae bacterium]|nr:hypothetical protein [Alicyclobacillaceae bacterium]
MDILLELEGGRLLHLFLHYDAAIAEKYRRKVRTVILYTLFPGCATGAGDDVRLRFAGYFLSL